MNVLYVKAVNRYKWIYESLQLFVVGRLNMDSNVKCLWHYSLTNDMRHVTFYLYMCFMIHICEVFKE